MRVMLCDLGVPGSRAWKAGYRLVVDRGGHFMCVRGVCGRFFILSDRHVRGGRDAPL